VDIGGFLGYLGNLLFGGGQKKKRQDEQPQPTIQRPQQQSLIPQPQQNSPATVQLPEPLRITPMGQGNQPPKLGGVKMNQPSEDEAIAQANEAIKKGGAGAPFAPEVVAAARANRPIPQEGPIPEKKPSPVENYAKTFYGGVNDIGSLAGTLIGSLIPFGDANLYSDKGRENFVRNLQKETYDPSTGRLFTAGSEAVDKLERDADSGNTEALAGDLGTSLLNALSFIPAERLFVAGKEAATSGANAILPNVLKGAGIGGGFGAASGATQAMQQNASAPDVALSAVQGFGPAALFGGLIPGGAGAAGQLRSKIGGVPEVQATSQTVSPTTPVIRGVKSPAITSRNQTAAPTPQAVTPTVLEAPAATRPSPALVDGVDPRVQQANTAADNLIMAANKALESEGSSYAQVVRKLYNNNRKDGTVTALTPAERRVAQTVQPKLNKILTRMNDLGLTDADMGIINDYLPTTKFDELGGVRSISDIEGQDFGFTKTRGNKLSDEDVEKGSEQALKNYLATGSLLDDVTPELVGKVKLSRRDKEFIDLLETDSNGANTGLRASDEEIASARQSNQKLIDAEKAQSDARKRVSSGDDSDEALSMASKAEQDANDARIEKQVNDYMTLERKTDAEIENIRNSPDLTPEDKSQRITQLESHLTDVRNQTYYLQSGTRTNLLLGVGRVADQVNKGVQAVNDKTTGLARVGANRSFKKSTGRDVFSGARIANKVWNEVKKNPALNKSKNNARITGSIVDRQTENKGILSKIAGGYRLAGTRITEAGSRYRIAAKDTVSYFVSKAQSEGITDTKGIADYVNNSIGTKEWNRVHNSLFEARNTFTGLPTSGNASTKAFKFDVAKSINNALVKVPGISRNVRESISDGLTIPIIGFPRLLFRLGVRGFDNATLGVGDFIKASRISPRNEAEALKKALLVQQGLRSAQNGGSLGALGFMLGASGMTTGAYPSDPNERARWEKDKIQPFSLKVGDQYVDIGRYAGPLAFPLMIGAAIGRGKPEDIPGTVGEVTKQFLANYGADSVGDVLSTAGNLLSGKFDLAGKDLNRWLAGVTSAFIPTSSLLNTAGKAEDMVKGEAAPDGSGNALNALRARLPGVREGLPDKVDSLGNPISQGTPANLLPGVSGGQSGGQTSSDNRQDSVMSEIDRLAALKFEVMPSKDVENTNSQNDAESLISSDLYKGSDDKTRAEYLKETLAGSKTNDINSSLDETKRASLIQYELQNDDQRDKWLDDNNNAASYYQAAYDNSKANKTLTSEDDNLQEKSGLKYKAIEAKVNKEFGADSTLKSLYDQISKSDFKDMLDPNEDDYDPELATKLYDYDQARTKAGVSGNKFTDKPKYNLNSGKGGKGSKGGRGSKNFAFASLPASLIGSKSGGSGSKSYAEAVPLYKPIADLKAPPSVAVPRGRTISAKRGRQV